MRRAALTLGSTAAGLAALLTFKTHPGAGAAAATTAGTPPPSTAPAAPAHSARPSAKKSATGTGVSTGPGTGATAATRTVTGAVASTQYGPMQVQLTLAGDKITKVSVLQQTDTGTLSAQIDSMAIPKLTSETLAAQSARIDAVSGASYTSSGYIQSLQSALDKARA
jgi:uncharacterized protein with FMN-binding domain